MTMDPDLSGSLPSTWNSKAARGRCTAFGMAPCSYSSGSRTSRKVTPPPSSRACASDCPTSRMDALASFNRSRGVGTNRTSGSRPDRPCGRLRTYKPTSGVNIPGLITDTRRCCSRRCETARSWSSTRSSAGVRWCAASPLTGSTAPPSTGSSTRPFAPLPPAIPAARHGSCWRAPGRPPPTGMPPQTPRGGTATRPGSMVCAAPRWSCSPIPPPPRMIPATPSRTSRTPGSALASAPVPYWFGDTAFAVMTVLLGAVDAGLGACLLGNFRGEGELGRTLGVPASWRLFGAVVLGQPDGHDSRSRSLDRPLPPRSGRIHWGRW